jgi:hypothetical protein
MATDPQQFVRQALEALSPAGKRQLPGALAKCRGAMDDMLVVLASDPTRVGDAWQRLREAANEVERLLGRNAVPPALAEIMTWGHGLLPAFTGPHGEGIRLRLMQVTRRQARKDLDRIEAGIVPTTKRRRRSAPRQPVPLTPDQIEALLLVGEHKGSVPAAAKAAGKSRQAMQKLYDKATKKLGTDAVKRLQAKPARAEPLPADRRGQTTVADSKAPNPNAVG